MYNLSLERAEARFFCRDTELHAPVVFPDPDPGAPAARPNPGARAAPPPLASSPAALFLAAEDEARALEDQTGSTDTTSLATHIVPLGPSRTALLQYLASIEAFQLIESDSTFQLAQLVDGLHRSPTRAIAFVQQKIAINVNGCLWWVSTHNRFSTQGMAAIWECKLALQEVEPARWARIYANAVAVPIQRALLAKAIQSQIVLASFSTSAGTPKDRLTLEQNQQCFVDSLTRILKTI